jgi:hypothetical protein
VGKERWDMRQHVRIVGILHIALGALWILAAIIVFAVLMAVAFLPEDVEGQQVLVAVGIGVPLFMLVLSLPQLIGGIFLLRYRPWARYLVMIVGALGLLSIPIGTVVGVYTLWVLMQEETAWLFPGGSSH